VSIYETLEDALEDMLTTFGHFEGDDPSDTVLIQRAQKAMRTGKGVRDALEDMFLHFNDLGSEEDVDVLEQVSRALQETK
jgi:hypothetical protein